MSGRPSSFHPVFAWVGLAHSMCGFAPDCSASIAVSSALASGSHLERSSGLERVSAAQAVSTMSMMYFRKGSEASSDIFVYFPSGSGSGGDMIFWTNSVNKNKKKSNTVWKPRKVTTKTKQEAVPVVPATNNYRAVSDNTFR